MNIKKMMTAAVHGALLAGSATARSLQGLAPTPSPEQPFSTDVLIDCLPHERYCPEDGVYAQGTALNLKAPGKFGSAAGTDPSATPMTGRQQCGYTIPVTFGDSEPFSELDAIFDTGSTTTVAFSVDAVETEVNALNEELDELDPEIGLPLLTNAPLPSNVERYRATPSDERNATTLTGAYGKGDWTADELDTDTLGVKGWPRVQIPFAVADSATSFVETSSCGDTSERKVGGLIGMALNGNDEPVPGTAGYYPAVASQAKNASFTVALCDKNGNAWWGAPQAKLQAKPMAYVSVREATHAHSVWLMGIEIGSTRLPFGSSDLGPALLDTGSSNDAFPSAVLESIADAVAIHTGQDKWRSMMLNSACISLTKRITRRDFDAAMPTMTLVMQGADDANTVHRLTFSATNSYLTPVNYRGRDSLCFSSGTSDAFAGEKMTLIGNNHMVNNVLHFDSVSNGRIGFAPGRDTCV